MLAIVPSQILAQPAELNGSLGFSTSDDLLAFFHWRNGGAAQNVLFAQPFSSVPSISFSPSLPAGTSVIAGNKGFRFAGLRLLPHPLNRSLQGAIARAKDSDAWFTANIIVEQSLFLTSVEAAAFVYRFDLTAAGEVVQDSDNTGPLMVARSIRAGALEQLEPFERQWTLQTAARPGETWEISFSDPKDGTPLSVPYWRLQKVDPAFRYTHKFSVPKLLAVNGRQVLCYLDSYSFGPLPPAPPRGPDVRLCFAVEDQADPASPWKPIDQFGEAYEDGALQQFIYLDIADSGPSSVTTLSPKAGPARLALAASGRLADDPTNHVYVGKAPLYLEDKDHPLRDWKSPWEITAIASSTNRISGVSLLGDPGGANAVFVTTPPEGKSTLHLARAAVDGSGSWELSEIAQLEREVAFKVETALSAFDGRIIVAYQYLTYNIIGMLVPARGLFVSGKDGAAEWQHFPDLRFGQYVEGPGGRFAFFHPTPELASGFGIRGVDPGLLHLPRIDWRATAEPQIRIAALLISAQSDTDIELEVAGVPGSDYDLFKASALEERPRWEAVRRFRVEPNGLFRAALPAASQRSFYRVQNASRGQESPETRGRTVLGQGWKE